MASAAQGLAFERDLVLLHHFEQRALRLGGGAVDLVGQQDVREHRAAHDAQLLRAGSSTAWPVMSDGIMSGVNCTRACAKVSARAMARTSSVLPRPGTPSIEHVAGCDQRDEHLLDDL